MKLRTVAATLLVMLVCQCTFGADLLIETRSYFPQEMKDFYVRSPGATLQLHHWFGESFGIGLSGGYEDWGTSSHRTSYIDNNGYPGTTSLSGTNEFFTTGLHGLWKFQSEFPYKKADWLVSAGLVYLMPNSGSKLHQTTPVSEQEYNVHIQNTYALEVGVLMRHVLETPIALGFGYRRTLGGGNISVPDIGFKTHNDMDSFFLRAGLIFEF